jgi:hypothetical protein
MRDSPVSSFGRGAGGEGFLPPGLRYCRSLPHPQTFSLREKGAKLPSPLSGERPRVRNSPLSLWKRERG